MNSCNGSGPTVIGSATTHKRKEQFTGTIESKRERTDGWLEGEEEELANEYGTRDSMRAASVRKREREHHLLLYTESKSTTTYEEERGKQRNAFSITNEESQ